MTKNIFDILLFAMQPQKIIVAFFIIIAILTTTVYAVQDFPFTNITARFPGIDAPYPGLSNGFSSLGNGIRTVLWNPAGLAKIEKSEVYFGVNSTSLSSQASKLYNVEDQTFTIGDMTGESFSNKVLFTNDPTATELATREFRAPIIYSPSTSGMDYKQAIKVNDWFTFGISSKGDTDIGLSVAGNFPAQYLLDSNLYGSTDFLGSGISVNSDGKLTYSQTSPIPYTYTSTGAAWSDFLSQTQRIPFTVNADMKNNVNVQSTLIFTGAAKVNDLSLGINFTPMSANLNVDNTAKAIVNAGTADFYLYTPNFNPNDANDVLNWTSDPNLYGTEAGYQKNYVRVPAGESVGEAKYTGFYNASAIRTDLGCMYDFGNVLTLGAVLENFGAAGFNLKGTGQVAYVDTRINTTESPTITTTGNQIVFTWNPFTDTFTPMDGTENIGMLPAININLPQKTKLGLTLRKPLLITIDYELQNNPLVFTYQSTTGAYVEAQFSNIGILKLGMETQVFALPMWLKGSLSFLMKPNVIGLDSSSEASFNQIFVLFDQYAPLSLDLSTAINLWGYKVGGAFGIDGSSLLSVLQLDTLNSNFGKTMYYNISLDKDYWHCVLQNNLDISSTATAYSNADKNGTINSSSTWTDYLQILRWTTTLTVGYKF
ncbi:hypothetical protein A3J90_06295 [candidate division WOR-1 bacterium RIFOXYC2_FULL_37_10]|nr:MAG: hypothetical protein A2246_01920 [candidate division WOR-1 bacterium RIFOXYA2_FULL_37_7]OGC35712.1 MAG: hypothetical protein A3J90_06295 [candidate division WOR-1 bacterium RIFOXYC2_FULL_37_10]